MTSSIDANLNVARLQAQVAKQDRALAVEKATPRERQEIRQISNEFESLFLNLVLKAMRDTVPKSGLVDGGNAEDIYKSLLDDEYTKMMAAQRSTGIADNIEEFLLRAQADTRATPETDQAAGRKAYQDEGLRIEGKQAKIKNGAVRAL